MSAAWARRRPGLRRWSRQREACHHRPRSRLYEHCMRRRDGSSSGNAAATAAATFIGAAVAPWPLASKRNARSPTKQQERRRRQRQRPWRPQDVLAATVAAARRVGTMATASASSGGCSDSAASLTRRRSRRRPSGHAEGIVTAAAAQPALCAAYGWLQRRHSWQPLLTTASASLTDAQALAAAVAAIGPPRALFRVQHKRCAKAGATVVQSSGRRVMSVVAATQPSPLPARHTHICIVAVNVGAAAVACAHTRTRGELAALCWW
jgi:hypothetical protein